MIANKLIIFFLLVIYQICDIHASTLRGGKINRRRLPVRAETRGQKQQREARDKVKKNLAAMREKEREDHKTLVKNILKKDIEEKEKKEAEKKEKKKKENAKHDEYLEKLEEQWQAEAAEIRRKFGKRL